MTDISKEYAAAVFELARELSAEKEFSDALLLVDEVFSAEQDYMFLLEAPNILVRERQALLKEAFADKIPEYVLSFIELLCANRRIGLIHDCINEYQKMYKALSLISSARIVSAVDLNENEKNVLIKKLEKLTGNKISASYEIDESIIGGVIIYIDDKVIDGSIRYKINEVREVIGK